MVSRLGRGRPEAIREHCHQRGLHDCPIREVEARVGAQLIDACIPQDPVCRGEQARDLGLLSDVRL
jgi:hypothetical protein